ncbi:MAG: tetratricopeptide repeat protein [Candidatus Omnitrophota bacterium]
MKQVKKYYYPVFILYLLLCVCVFENAAQIDYCFAQEEGKISLEGLKEKSEEYFSAHRYKDFIELLGSYANSAPPILYPYLEYYTAQAKVEHLNHLGKEESWPDYYNLKNEYLDYVLRVTNALSQRNPPNVFAVDSQYLNWYAHMLREDKEEKAAFRKFKEILSSYVIETKNAQLINEYASRLKDKGRLSLSALLYNLYVTRSLEARDYAPLFDIVSVYQKERQYEQMQLVLREALDSDLPEETACRVLLLLAESYMKLDDRESAFNCYARILKDYACNEYSYAAFYKIRDIYYLHDSDKEVEPYFVPQDNKIPYAELLKEAADKHAATELAVLSLYLLADFYQDRGGRFEAIALYQKIISDYPDSMQAISAAKKMKALGQMANKKNKDE